MRLTFTLFSLLLLSTSLQAQKITGIWRGYFSAANGIFRDDIDEEMYKYEVQIDQQSNNVLRVLLILISLRYFMVNLPCKGFIRQATKI